MVLLSIITCKSTNNVIGLQNKLPWHLPADLRHFKRITMGHPIIMGRKTFQSIGRPLPGRQNIILTRSRDFHAEGCRVVHGLPFAVDAARGHEQAFIIGGESIYRAALPIVRRIFLTQIHTEFRGDAFFPTLNMTDWEVKKNINHEPDDENRYAFSFMMLERKPH